MSYLNSMTAFGASSKETPIGTISIDIQSYNRKHIDIRVHSPNECSQYTLPIQKRVGERISRGAVTVRVNVEYKDECPFKITPNLPLAREYKEAVQKIEDELGLKNSHILTSLLSKSHHVFQVTGTGIEDEAYLASLMEVLDEAIDSLVQMRKFEGGKLKEDLEKRLQIIEGNLTEVKRLSKGSLEREKEKLMQLFSELQFLEGEKEAALIREITLFADKIDIEEEITRFYSHIAQFRKNLDKGDRVGKTLDFIIQEMMRETNTIGSKSQRGELIDLVIGIKAEIERMREQVQNIE